MKALNINDTDNRNNDLFDILSDDIFEESSYGLEYIIDEILKENKFYSKIHDHSADWFGLYDLCI